MAERWGIPGQIHPWGRTPPGDERLQEGHSEKRAAPPISTAVLGQVRALGSPVACLRLLRAEDAGGQASTGLGKQPSCCLSSQPEPWLLACNRDGSGCTQPVHAGHQVSTSGAEVLQKGVLLRSRGVQQAWSEYEFGGGVFPWRGPGEGWLRHGQVLGSGKEGDRGDILENNGRGRLGMEKKEIDRSLEDNAVGKEEALVTGGGGRTKQNKREAV